MYKTTSILTIVLIIMLAVSCTNKEQEETDERNAYLQENNITVAPTASGLYYIETQEGEGDYYPQEGDIVQVHYTGKLLNGEVFDSSEGGNPIQFTLGIGQVIPGWDEGIALMKRGGKATLIIPSDLAYGTSGSSSGSIPPYSTLVFEVELVSINLK